MDSYLCINGSVYRSVVLKKRRRRKRKAVVCIVANYVTLLLADPASLMDAHLSPGCSASIPLPANIPTDAVHGCLGVWFPAATWKA